MNQKSAVAPPEGDVIAEQFLEDGVTIKIVESRRSAVPPGIPGKHYIAGLFRGNHQLDFREVSDEGDHKASAFAKTFAKTMSRSGQFNHSGAYRIIENSPEMATRSSYHIHIVIFAATREQIEKEGWTLRRLVDPDSIWFREAVK